MACVFHVALLGLIVLLAAGWIARAFASEHRLIDLVAIAVGHAWPLGLLAVIVALLLRRWKSAACLAVVSVGLGLPVILPAAKSWRADAPSAQISLLLCNAQALGGVESTIASVILREAPDVVVLIEVYESMARRLAARPDIADLYPHTVLPRRGLAWPIVILSRHPMHELTLDLPPGADPEAYQQLFAFRRSQLLDTPAGRFILSVVHAPSPRTDETWANGNEVVAMIAALCENHLSALDQPILIAGDFNTTPFGWRASLLRQSTDLHFDAAERPFTGTWPTDLPSSLRLPIDQVWHSSETVIVRREVLEDVGSDHRPILVTIGMAE